MSASTRLTQEAQETFSQAVNYIIKEWPALDLAIENGMGGSHSLEIRDWMTRVVIDSFVKDPDMELNYFLTDILDQEFDTVIEDGSLEYNVQWINKFYKDCVQGKQQEVQEQIAKAKQKKLSLGNMRIPAPIRLNQDSSEEETDEDES